MHAWDLRSDQVKHDRSWTWRRVSVDSLDLEGLERDMAVHMNTVAGNEMLVLESAKRYPNAIFFGLNPGVIKTNIRRNLFAQSSPAFGIIEGLIGFLGPSAEHYAEMIVPLLVSPDLEGRSGALFDRKGQAILPSPRLSESHMAAFLSASEALIAKTLPNRGR
jgi:hypothetical protein